MKKFTQAKISYFLGKRTTQIHYETDQKRLTPRTITEYHNVISFIPGVFVTCSHPSTLHTYARETHSNNLCIFSFTIFAQYKTTFLLLKCSYSFLQETLTSAGLIRDKVSQWLHSVYTFSKKNQETKPSGMSKQKRTSRPVQLCHMFLH